MPAPLVPSTAIAFVLYAVLLGCLGLLVGSVAVSAIRSRRRPLRPLERWSWSDEVEPPIVPVEVPAEPAVAVTLVRSRPPYDWANGPYDWAADL